MVISTVAPLSSSTIGTISGAVGLILASLLFIVTAAGLIKIFQKAGQSWWKALIPFYNIWVILKINNNNPLWVVGWVIPIINIYAAYKIFGELAYNFGKGHGWAIIGMLMPFILIPLLGFVSADYNRNAIS